MTVKKKKTTVSSSKDVITVPNKFIPRPYQLELFKAMDNGLKRAILLWHRRAGKDKTCFCYMAKEAAKTPGNYFYVFPTKEMARKALWENVDKDGFKLLHHIPDALIKRISNQEMIIEYVNGSTIRVVGFDKNPDSVRGIACKGAVFSEFAFSDPDAFKIMTPAIRESRGWVIFNSTPNGKNHYHELWERTHNVPERWFASMLQTLWPDKPGYSGLVPEEDFPMIMDEEGSTWEDVEREYGVAFTTGAKGSFYIEAINKARDDNRIGHYTIDDMYPVHTYWDIGISDETAIWFIQHIGNKYIIVDYYQNSGKGTNFYAEVLKDKNYRYGIHHLPHDAGHRKQGQEVSTTEEDLVTSLQAYNVSADTEILPKTSKQFGINAVRLKLGRCYFSNSEDVEFGLKLLEQYKKKWDNKKQAYLKEPVHDLASHAADAFRMFGIADDPGDYYKMRGNVKVDWDYDIFND